MWVALAKSGSLLARMGAFAFSVVSLALVALSLSERDWMDGMSIYIVSLGCASILITLIPPYPNFIIDAFFALAWLVAAVFAFLILFLKSTCYGIGQGTSDAVACPKYQALVAMCFFAFGAWSTCAALGLLLILIAIFKNARLKSNHYFRDNTIVHEDGHRQERDYGGEHTMTGVLSPPISADIDTTEDFSSKTAEFAKGKNADFRNGKDEGLPGGKSTTVVNEKYAGFNNEKRKGNDWPVYDAAPAVIVDRSHTEEKYAPKEPDYMRVQGLFADFILQHWLLLGLAGLVLMAILLPIVIIYGVPAFASYVMDNLQVPNTLYGTIQSFEEDYATFDITSDIKSPVGISATIEPMKLAMFNPETLPNPIPIAYIDTQEIKLKGGQKVHADNGRITVGNMTEWTKLWRKFFFQPVMDVGLKGRLVMHIGPMKIGVDVLKVVDYQGILNATTLKLNYLKIQPPDKDGANVLISLPLVNPAILTLNSTALVTADFTIGNTLLAQAFIDNFALKKGNNTLNARAKVDLETVLGLLQNITQVIGTEMPYLSNGVLVTGLQTTNITAGGHSWPYWVRAFRGIDLLAGIELSSIGGNVIDNVAAQAIGGLLTGTGGAFITQESGGITDINVTLINKILRNMTIIDAAALEQ